MAKAPPLDSKRFTTIPYLYTSDNDQQFLTTFRLYKDIKGDPFVPLPPSLISRITTLNTKDQFWGESKDRRKALIQVVNPSNSTGTTNTFLPIPQSPTEGITGIYLEIFDSLKTKYDGDKGNWCLNYLGEKRYTKAPPITVRELDLK